MGLQPINWPSAGSVRPAQGSASLFPSRSLMPPDGQDGRSGGKTRQSEPDSERKAQAAYAQGHQDGAAAAQHEAQAQVRTIVERMARSIDEMTGMRQRLRHEAEEDVIALAIAIARRVLHREITMDPGALLGLAKAALEKIDVRELHRVRLNPENVAMVQQELEKIGLPRRVEVVADPSLERGAVILETGRGMLDASVETQLVEIERGFADMVRHSP
jgi:flagellar assembly protein FliH